MEISFSEFRAKTVINLTDGRKLGHVIDLVFNQNNAQITGIVVPGGRSGLFKGKEDLFIPYQCICKIGLDTILVQLSPMGSTAVCSSTPYISTNNLVNEAKNDGIKRKYVVYSPESNE